MKSETCIVNKDSFGYKFLKQNYNFETDMPRSECAYYRTLIIAFFTYFLWKPAILLNKTRTLFDNIVFGLIAYFGTFMFGSMIYGMFLLFFIQVDFDDGNFFHTLGAIGSLIIFVLLLVGIYSLIKLLVTESSRKILQLNDNEVPFNFIENVKKFKRKICRPVEYR